MKSNIGDCFFGLGISILLYTHNEPEMAQSCAGFLLGWFGFSLVVRLLTDRR